MLFMKKPIVLGPDKAISNTPSASSLRGRVNLRPTITYVLQGIESVAEALEITANKGKYKAINPAQVMFQRG